jgi:hypothetical protein
MKPGDLVETKDGRGTVVDVQRVYDPRWSFGKPLRQEWEVVVRLDVEPERERRYLTTRVRIVPEEVANE